MGRFWVLETKTIEVYNPESMRTDMSKSKKIQDKRQKKNEK